MTPVAMRVFVGGSKISEVIGKVSKVEASGVRVWLSDEGRALLNKSFIRVNSYKK